MPARCLVWRHPFDPAETTAQGLELRLAPKQVNAAASHQMDGMGMWLAQVLCCHLRDLPMEAEEERHWARDQKLATAVERRLRPWKGAAHCRPVRSLVLALFPSTLLRNSWACKVSVKEMPARCLVWRHPFDPAETTAQGLELRLAPKQVNAAASHQMDGMGMWLAQVLCCHLRDLPMEAAVPKHQAWTASKWATWLT